MAMRKGLGKGLGALFGDINEQTETPAEGAVSLPLQKIEPNPLQPRKTFDPDEGGGPAGAPPNPPTLFLNNRPFSLALFSRLTRVQSCGLPIFWEN